MIKVTGGTPHLIKMLILLFVIFLVTTAIAQCPTTPPNCANYPNRYFVNNVSNCRAYWYCANASSPPAADLCPENFNFDEANQLCNHPSNFPCNAGGSGGSAQCPSTPPNCANYPNGYFINNLSNCRAYWYCANANSQPAADMCPVNFNFDQANQLCNHPSNFPCTESGAPPTTSAPIITGPPITTPPTTSAPIITGPPITTPPITTPPITTPPITTPPITTTTTTPPGSGDNFLDVAVREHNRYRAIHSSPNVASFSFDINNFAQQWADHLASADLFEHSSGSGFGENLYKAWGGSADPNVIVADAIKYFYDEIRFYDFNNPGFSMQTGHFTQVVWRSSIEIGVGVAIFPDPSSGRRSVVCINYRPPGNWAGQFPENVLRPSSTRSLDSNFNSTVPYAGEKPIKIMVL